MPATPDVATADAAAAASAAGHDETDAAIVVTGLVKTYGDKRAVDGIDLRVMQGETFGVLGPNGAGKTTTLEMITGLRTPTSGSIRVLGFDPATERNSIRNSVAIQPQQAELFPHLTAKETLTLWAAFYADPLEPDELLDRVGLQAAANVRVHQLSGGQERRLLIATALVGSPDLIVLDEPSTGLDPNSRAELWEVLIDFRRRGGTVLLSTHAMEEAEALCDRIAVIDRGKVIAEGTPVELIQKHAPEQVVGFARDDAKVDELTGHPQVVAVDVRGNRATVRTRHPDAVVALLMAGPTPARDVTVQNPGLDGVFRELTGRSLDHQD